MNSLKKNKVSERKIERLLIKLSLLKIRKSLIIEEDSDYYSDTDNIEERFEISRKNYFEHGCEWIEIDYLIFWKNGYFSFSKMNRTNLRTNSLVLETNSSRKLKLCKLTENRSEK